MNILTEKLPDYIEIEGTKIYFNTDFRVWLKFSIFLQSENSDNDKILYAIGNVFKKLPQDIEKAGLAAMLFFAGGREDNSAAKERNEKRIYDYEFDSEYIYAGFLQQYGINLQAIDMHWWQFRALFNALGEDTQFIKIIEYRNMDVSKIKDSEQRNFYQRMKDRYALPLPKLEKEQISRIEEALLNGGDLSGIL